MALEGLQVHSLQRVIIPALTVALQMIPRRAVQVQVGTVIMAAQEGSQRSQLWVEGSEIRATINPTLQVISLSPPFLRASRYLQVPAKVSQ
jgi:hypothetical protein